jgi:hypothetical protein
MSRASNGRFVPELMPRSIADLAAWLTPKEAAHVKYMVAMLRAASVQDEHTRRLDEMMHNDAEHRWFCFCLDAIARRA